MLTYFEAKEKEIRQFNYLLLYNVQESSNRSEIEGQDEIKLRDLAVLKRSPDIGPQDLHNVKLGQGQFMLNI